MITQKTIVNDHGVAITVFSREGIEIGHMFTTYHPTIPYEVYRADFHGSRRVHSAEEAAAWLESEQQQTK